MSNERYLVAEGRTDIAPLRVCCRKHAALGEPIAEVGKDACPHCAEDAKILDEAIQRVVVAVHPGVRPEMRAQLTDALRDLIREARR